MRAFHGDPAIKEKYLARVRAHRAADELVRGTGWSEKGGRVRACAVGCTLDKYDHASYETELGIPIRLAFLEDRIFERLPTEDDWKPWPEAFLDAIPVGADLRAVWAKFSVWKLTEAIEPADLGKDQAE